MRQTHQIEKQDYKKLRLISFELRKKEKAYLWASIIDFAQMFITAFLVALFLQGFMFEFTYVEGPSMEPTLFTGERMIVEKLSYGWSDPERGDIIICHYPGRTDTCVKRVIGLPGEIIAVRDGSVYIDGKRLDERRWWDGYIMGDMSPVAVPARTVFVLGDNRNNSSDSRMVGPIAYERFVGRVRGILWPFDRFTIGVPNGGSA